MDSLQIKMCDIQGRLFEKSLDEGLDSELFIKCFMNSKIAEGLDSKYNRMQWSGEEYLLEELIAVEGNNLPKSNNLFAKEVLYWSGYLYRYWHYKTGESSKKIYKQASALDLKRNYKVFHTIDPEIAIEDLIEIHMQKHDKSRRVSK